MVWLTDINNVEDLEAETLYQKGLFAYRVSYNIIDGNLNNRVKELYNGNITRIYRNGGVDDPNTVV